MEYFLIFCCCMAVCFSCYFIKLKTKRKIVGTIFVEFNGSEKPTIWMECESINDLIEASPEATLKVNVIKNK